MNGKKYIKKVVAAVMLLAVAGMGAGSTIAYFTDKDTKANSFSTGGLDVELQEPEWNPEKEGDGKDLYPGYTVYKNPTVKNITDPKKGAQPCYVRMLVEILDEEGNVISDPDALKMIYKTIYYDAAFDKSYESGTINAGLVQGREPGYCLKELSAYPMVNPEWQKDTLRSVPSKLVFNYVGERDAVLDIGEESTLFTSLVIPTDWDGKQIENIGDFQLRITSQAIQCQSFTTPQEAWKALDTGETNGAAAVTAMG